MKILMYLLASMLLPMTQMSYASAQDGTEGDLSPSEIRLCRKNGCFGQGVSKDIVITNVGKEKIVTDKTKNTFLNIPVIAKGEDFEIEYTINQWIGSRKILDKAKQENARDFARKLNDLRKSGKAVNLVVQGSANQMTAEFPLLGYFTNDGDFFFLDRVIAPLLDKM